MGLVNKRIMALYRPGNWRFTNLGFQIAHFLRTLKARRYGLTKVRRRG